MARSCGRATRRWSPRYVEQAAGRIERFAGYLENKKLPELVADADRFARRQPALLMGGAFVLGLMAARFLKSSRYSGSNAGYAHPSQGYGEPGYYNPYASGRAQDYATRGAPAQPHFVGTVNPPPADGNTKTTIQGAAPQQPPYEPTV